MKKSGCLFFAFVLASFLAGPVFSESLEADNLCRIALDPQGKGPELVLLDNPGEETLWMLLENNQLRTFRYQPDVPGRWVENVLPSPDGNLLAVVTASEGHTDLAVFNLHQLLHQGGRIDAQPVLVVFPYPDNVFIQGWSEDGLILEYHREEGGSYRETIPFSDIPESTLLLN